MLVAQQDNVTKSAAVIGAVKSVADPALEVSTADFSIVMQHPVDGQVQSTAIRGYEVTNRVAVQLGDLTKVGTLLDRAAQAGENAVTSVAFGLEDSRAIRRQVLTEATPDARRAPLCDAPAPERRYRNVPRCTWLEARLTP